MVLSGEPEQYRAELDSIARQLEKILDTKCRFTFCKTIPTEKTGKYLYVRSELE